ncbi:MAG: hypothetical protein JWN61_2991, partial [Pseudonocardiales bacterium]|nr:hypothetical protein [Pseudonocardiales bacterium]
MAGLFASLTGRARSLIAAGASAAFCGVALGERDLIRVGFLLIALPVVGALIVGRARVTIEASRAVSHQRAAVGAAVEVSLRVTNTGLFPVAGLMLEDRLPAVRGGAPDQRARFALGILRSGQTTDIVYPLPALPRGRFTIGPLHLRMTDPFGLVEMVRPFPAVSEIVVVPQIHELGAQSLPGGHEELGGSSIHAVGSLGADDLTVREYRQGDDVRKIHWRSSARTGELMVRQEERPWQGDVVVLVDSRRRTHRGEGAHSSLEWIVSAAASIADHLERRGYRVTIVSGGFARDWPGLGGAETLADLQLSTDAQLGAGLPTGTGSAATLIALVAAPIPRPNAGTEAGDRMPALMADHQLPGADVDALTALPAQVRMLLALDTSDWPGASSGPPPSAAATRRGGPIAGTATSLSELAADGWHVSSANAD